ncbi:Transketolase [uncultured spirochete]|uniref:Transketolase n=1 Tax=uncultured spirochete TaxID=156406 RepID=A0A3P3XQB0_9SPIR|nr:Transketolase [uncultured spirochete]
MNKEALKKIALSVRSLSMDAVQEANSGHPGLPLGAAELGAFLYGEAMKYDPSDPIWIDRDRFVLSAGHGSMFLYSMLHMAGFGISLDDIKCFRKVGSPCAGHPEYDADLGIEMTTGPLGQGVSTAVGMAMAETMLAAKFNTEKRKIFDHYTWVLVGDGCLQEGIASEASSLAGHFKLGKLIVFYDSNDVTIDGPTGISFTEDVAKRYEAYGWKVLKGDMYDFAGIEKLVAEAKADIDRPKLIILKSMIGKGAPTKQGTNKVHGSPLGEEEIARAKETLGIPKEQKFWVAPEAYEYFGAYKQGLESRHARWTEEFEAWKREEPALARELDVWYSGDPLSEVKMPTFAPDEPLATRAASGKVLQAIAAAWPNFVGGSADLTSPNVSALNEVADYTPENRSGRYIRFGIREHAMAAIGNGLMLHGGLRPFVATFLSFVDYLRPALRLSALMKLPLVYVLTHDSIYVGEDGPTHEPIEQLASIRAIPNVLVLRPADGEETAEAWSIAMKRKDGPTVLVLGRNNVPFLKKDDPDWRADMAKGAYIVRDTKKTPDVVIVATGSEVSLALEAAKLVPAKSVRVVSMPCREAFLRQPERYQAELLPKTAKIVVAEAGVAQGWGEIAQRANIFSIDRFGASGPAGDVAKHLGFTVERLSEIIAR